VARKTWWMRWQRAEAVKEVCTCRNFRRLARLASACGIILRQAEEKGITPAAKFEYLPDSAHEEMNLGAYVETNGSKVEALRNKKEYGNALVLLSTHANP